MRKLKLFINEVPRLTKFADGGTTVEVPVYLEKREIEEFAGEGEFESEDFRSLEEALRLVKNGAIVTCKWNSLATYKFLQQYGHEGEPAATDPRIKIPAPSMFGAWEVTVRAIKAKYYTVRKTGKTTIVWEFCGLKPVGAGEGDVSIPADMLAVKDLSKVGEE